MNERKGPPPIRGSHADNQTAEIEGARQPEGYLDEHADLRLEQRAGRHRPVQEDIRFLFVEEHFARRRGDEHAQKDEGHPVQIDRERKDRLAAEEQRKQAEERIEHQGERQLGSDRLRRGLLLQAARRAAAQEQRKE